MEKKKKLNIDNNILLKEIVDNIPYYIFWKDENLIFQGCNKLFANQFGYDNSGDLIGKSDRDFPWPKELRDKYNQDDLYVIQTGKSLLNIEETQTQSDGSMKTVLVSKVPLRLKGKKIGVLGIYADITKQKKMETDLFAAEERAAFVKIADQVAHDIRSPLASLLMIVKSCVEIPEAERIALREAAISIGDIANSLLHRYKSSQAPVEVSPQETDERQPILVSATLLQLLADKKYEYQHEPLKFSHHIDPAAHVAFIEIEPSAFKRMLSNLLNNAVEAIGDRPGKIQVSLSAEATAVHVSIEDSGKGMSKELLEKIRQQGTVASDKKLGHGIGLVQVCETLQRYQAEMQIKSALGQGTTITLTFPRVPAPAWMAEKIDLTSHDIVVILDDDHSIHGAWRAHLEPFLRHKPHMELKHFTTAKEGLQFLTSLTPDEKERVFLLTDYELLKQDLNGLQVIADSKVKRSLLVTSHYANPDIQAQAAKAGTLILPKQLASEIEIEIREPLESTETSAKKIDFILVDDDKAFARSLISFVFMEENVDYYQDPQHFLNNVAAYAKDTKMLLDNQFKNSVLSGIDLAHQLHEQGYTRLYLLSGQDFEKGALPDYLTVIRKDDIPTIEALAKD